jgi:hypothetical protein
MYPRTSPNLVGGAGVLRGPDHCALRRNSGCPVYRLHALSEFGPSKPVRPQIDRRKAIASFECNVLSRPDGKASRPIATRAGTCDKGTSARRRQRSSWIPGPAFTRINARRGPPASHGLDWEGVSLGPITWVGRCTRSIPTHSTFQ